MKRIRSALWGATSLLLAVVPLLINATPVGANSYFGGNGRLAFYSPVTLDSTAQEIYTVKPDGTDLKRVTNNNTADANPQWAPSGLKLAFDHYVDSTNQQDIYIQNMNADGSASGSPTVLSGANTTEREFDPSWSQSGTTIAFHRRGTVGGTDPYHIFTISASGGSVSQITIDDGFADTEPTWRSDGNYLVFGHRNVATDENDIAIAPNTASATVTIIDQGSSPQWSPTANKVVYSKNGEIWTYDQDTSTTAQLTNGATVTSAPTWSPDGKLIAASTAGTINYYDATTGDVVATHSVATDSVLGFTSSNNANELDWARAAAPPSTEHSCTTNVNEDCKSFSPEIPALCQTIITAAAHGTPKFADNAFAFTPEKDYVGNDTYIYRYFDENMNAITCTVHITVVPKAPNTGTSNGSSVVPYAFAGALVLGGAFILRRKFNR